MNIKAIWKHLKSIRFEMNAEYDKGVIAIIIKPFLWTFRIEGRYGSSFGARVWFGPFLFDIAHRR